MKELITLPNPILRRQSRPVDIDGKVKALAGELVEFMLQRQDIAFRPVGLSAIQLGRLVRMFAFVANPRSGEEVSPDIQVIINPQLVYAKGSHLVEEGCLSVPGKTFVLQRAKIVKIKGLTLDGAERSFRGHDTLAQVFQHELDHLDGILIDQVGQEKGG